MVCFERAASIAARVVGVVKVREGCCGPRKIHTHSVRFGSNLVLPSMAERSDGVDPIIERPDGTQQIH